MVGAGKGNDARRGRVQLRRGCLLLAVALLSAERAGASEQSKRLYSQGLVAFHAGRMTEAEALFDRAVADDPADPYALYYRGVTRGRLGDSTGAIRDLRAVIDRQAPIKEAALELGVVLVEAGEYRDAVQWLEQAQTVPSQEGRAALFLGIAQLRLGRMNDARRSFERADTKDASLRMPARYYQGVVAYQEGKWSDAQRHFAYTSTYDPNSDMGREAAAFLEKLRAGVRPTGEVYGAVGLQYDSNVVLAPSDDADKAALQISRQADGRGVITLGGAYVPWRTERTELSVGYEFYQSLHFDLTEFNLQDHRPVIQGVVNAGIFQVGLLGRYDYYLLETDSFLQEASGFPWVAMTEGDIGRTEVFYRVRRRDFKKRAFVVRDAFNHSAGVSQLFYLGSPDRSVGLGYRYDHESPVKMAGNPFAYDGHEASGGIHWGLPAAVAAEVSYAYRHEQYATAPSSGRGDDEHQVVVGASRPLNEYLAVRAAYFGNFNNSNKPDFDYDRHIGSLEFEVRFQ